LSRFSLILLGGFQARLASGHPLAVSTKKAQALLAYLALRPGVAHPRDKLAALLWGERPDSQARDSLRHTLGALRKALPATEPPSLVTEGHCVALNPAAADVDVGAFERRVAEGTPTALEHAAALYQGDLLEGLNVNEAPFEDWLLAERERLRELALEALAKLLAHQSQAGATERAIQTAGRLLALDPLQEVVHRTLMRLYTRQGRRGTALRQYQTCVGVLQREVGAEPEPETKQLYQEILRHPPPVQASADAGPGHRARRPPQTPALPRLDIPAPETALIGRDSELARLRQALEECSRGRGHIIALVGEAGIGKTRLLMALAADASRQQTRVLLGRSYESEQIFPFGPWVDAFRTGQLITDNQVLNELNPVWRAELARLLPELDAPGLPPPSDEYLRLFESVAKCIEGLAARQPVLVMLEDLHWADEMSLRLLAFLARRIQAAPILVVATAREEELASAPVLGRVLEELTREPHFRRLALLPLSRTDTTALVRSLARAGYEGSSLARLCEQVWALSEGNPFLVVEIMGARHEGATPQPLTGLSLPERVRQIIAGRLERLGDRGHALVATAAVIGREFDFALLERATGLGEREAAEGLEELVRRRVLHGVGERFDFTHDRIREVVYTELLPPRRKLVHRQVAEALEALYADNLGPHYAALGTHFHAGEVWGKALPYLRQAGAQASSRSAYREAGACFEQALATLEHLPESRDSIGVAIDLRFDLRNALYPLGDVGRSLTYLREAGSLSESLGDRHRQARAYAYLLTNFRQMGDPDRAIEAGQRALALALALGDVSLQVVTNLYLGATYESAGDCQRATDFLRRNVTSAGDDLIHERFGLPGFPLVASRIALAGCLAKLGNFTEGIAHGEEGVRMAEAIDQPYTLIAAYLEVGLAYLRKGELQRAISMLERGRALGQQGGFPHLVAATASGLGYAHALSGRDREALPPLEEGVERAASLGIVVHQSLRTAWLSEGYLLAGRIPDALQLAGRALELSRDHKERGNEACVLRLLGEIASRRDPPDVETAEGSYREALGLAGELGMRPLVAHCHLGLGRLHHRIGQVARARAELSTAIELFRAMDMTFWLGPAEAELARAESP
jgi:DNA-binding SARP family transcriptional activator